MNAVTRQSLDAKGNWVECSGADAPAGSAASSAPCSMATADSFVVVSLWRSPKGHEDYEYEKCATLNEAADLYHEYERGEFTRARAMGIFPARNGLPLAGNLDPVTLSKLMHETRHA